LQQATQRMLPYLLLSQTLGQLAQHYIRESGDLQTVGQERAISALEEALEQVPADAVADVWSSQARFLSSVYRTRRQGGRSDNFERVFTLYQQALEGPIREIDRAAWVRLLLDFSEAYVERKESRADRLDKLIDWLQSAIELPESTADLQQRALLWRALG